MSGWMGERAIFEETKDEHSPEHDESEFSSVWGFSTFNFIVFWIGSDRIASRLVSCFTIALDYLNNSTHTQTETQR